jgi:hypothetical protein
MVTIDEAAHCPRCDTIGEIAKKEVKRHFIENEWWDVYVYTCPNQVCPWWNTGWIVSSNERGIVYERPVGERGMPKSFPKLSKDQLAYGQRLVEDVVKKDLRDDENS